MKKIEIGYLGQRERGRRRERQRGEREKDRDRGRKTERGRQRDRKKDRETEGEKDRERFLGYLEGKTIAFPLLDVKIGIFCHLEGKAIYSLSIFGHEN